MRTISAAELSILAGELQEFVLFRIERFYETGEGRFRMKLKRGGVQANLQIVLSRTINRTAYTERNEQPSNFTMAVRKRIEGSIIESIRQLNNDRIAVFGLRKGEFVLDMVLEMFGAGNLIIADSSMRILIAYRQRKFRERSVAVGAEYMPPRQAEGYRLDIPEAATPTVFLDGAGRSVDYAIDDTARQGLQKRVFKSLQEALDLFYYDNQEGETADRESEQAKQLRLSIEKQRRLMRGAASEIETNKEIAERIFNNMAGINKLIDELGKNRRITKEELQEHAEKIKVVDLDLKEKKLIIEVD